MIVTSARVVEKSPSVMTRSILPWGEEWVIEGGANSEKNFVGNWEIGGSDKGRHTLVYGRVSGVKLVPSLTLQKMITKLVNVLTTYTGFWEIMVNGCSQA